MYVGGLGSVNVNVCVCQFLSLSDWITESVYLSVCFSVCEYVRMCKCATVNVFVSLSVSAAACVCE